jgi:hypothetical protein
MVTFPCFTEHKQEGQSHLQGSSRLF